MRIAFPDSEGVCHQKNIKVSKVQNESDLCNQSVTIHRTVYVVLYFRLYLDTFVWRLIY